MNDNQFIINISLEVKAIQALGECLTSFGTSYDMYLQAESKMSKFLHNNIVNLVACFDLYEYNANWTNTERVVRDMIELFDVGDYTEFLLILTRNNTVWKIRKKLENIHLDII